MEPKQKIVRKPKLEAPVLPPVDASIRQMDQLLKHELLRKEFAQAAAGMRAALMRLCHETETAQRGAVPPAATESG